MSDRKRGKMGGGSILLFFNYCSTSTKQSSTPLGFSFWEESKDLEVYGFSISYTKDSNTLCIRALPRHGPPLLR